MMNFETRYDFLKTALMRYDSYYHLSAIKASLLLTTNFILLAAVVNEESGLSDIMAGHGFAAALLLSGALLSLVSILFAALVVASYLGTGSPASRSSTLFSISVAVTPLEKYLENINSMDESVVLEDLARVVHHRALGLTRKFRRINVSLWTLFAAVVLTVVAYFV